MKLEEAIYELEDLIFDVEDRETVEAIKTVLQELEHLQKENEQYSKQMDLDYVDKNFVSKNKIRIMKEAIEELLPKFASGYVKNRLDAKKQILESLLKEEWVYDYCKKRKISR